MAVEIDVTSLVAFGDHLDLQGKKRAFLPGKYRMKKLPKGNIDTMVYHESVDPDLLASLLWHCESGEHLFYENYINRERWLTMRRPGGVLDERGVEECVFFVPVENLPDFYRAPKPNEFGISFSIEKVEEFDVDGCVCQDTNTGLYFALVAEEEYTTATLSCDEPPPLPEELEGMPNPRFKFDINRLKLKGDKVPEVLPKPPPPAKEIVITSEVAFGDIKDLHMEVVNCEPNDEDDTDVPEDWKRRKREGKVRKRFIPGKYKMKKLGSRDETDTLIYHESINPDLLLNVLWNCTYGDFAPNLIQTQEWLRCRADRHHPTMADTIYFLPVENLENFEPGSEYNQGLRVQANTPSVIGVLCQDKSTGKPDEKYFALLIKDFFMAETLGGDSAPSILPEMEGVPNSDFIFDRSKFQTE